MCNFSWNCCVHISAACGKKLHTGQHRLQRASGPRFAEFEKSVIRHLATGRQGSATSSSPGTTARQTAVSKPLRQALRNNRLPLTLPDPDHHQSIWRPGRHAGGMEILLDPPSVRRPTLPGRCTPCGWRKRSTRVMCHCHCQRVPRTSTMRKLHGAAAAMGFKTPGPARATSIP
uniref:Uncharacterized protein n=1 Tax=Candidatus Kentrum sp. LPFa TaxID=2126335 RepID=A0A450XM29_9GAMM|nr:MAG: hypothetical protein BECKLPF1236A_GA0070988_100998 [Candidatus Kentron sp. LPFa]VFK30327.1 MAG: hypothetical protein BECKLPF1236C_GA0070990_101088 [Candidatus Kentron sp. LPFa]